MNTRFLAVDEFAPLENIWLVAEPIANTNELIDPESVVFN
tara:strand:+ start:448 stop:567 length:120 start_codon:yes stop_codon:yes gene_type:complete